MLRRVACVVPTGMSVIVDQNRGSGGWIRLQVKVGGRQSEPVTLYASGPCTGKVSIPVPSASKTVVLRTHMLMRMCYSTCSRPPYFPCKKCLNVPLPSFHACLDKHPGGCAWVIRCVGAWCSAAGAQRTALQSHDRVGAFVLRRHLERYKP